MKGGERKEKMGQSLDDFNPREDRVHSLRF